MKKQVICLLALGAVSLSGCSTVQPSNSLKDIQVLMPESKALAELRDIAIEARSELRLLAKAQEAQSYKTLTKEQELERLYQSTVVPNGFADRVTFSYKGDAIKAANAIAQVVGYKFVPEGRPFISEPQVNISIKNQPLNEALRELGAQTGSGILIDVEPSIKVMKYVYKPRVR